MAAPWSVRYPISSAACQESASLLLSLLQQDPLPQPLDSLDEEGRAALHYSAWNGLLETTAALLHAGANVNVLSGDRQSTPLHFACGMGKPPVVEALLRNGADRSLQDIDKWTPRDLALQTLHGDKSITTAIVALLDGHPCEGGKK